jgi:hypothetical protein
VQTPLSPERLELNEVLIMHPDLVVGLFHAKQQLEVDTAAADANQPVDFWRECVRDTTGRWEAYTAESSYFLGPQPTVQYDNPREVEYLHANLRLRQAFYDGLPRVARMDLGQFEAWLEALHATMRYPEPPSHQQPIRFGDTIHSAVVMDQILPLAFFYDDPYLEVDITGPQFEGIPSHLLPTDSVDRKASTVIHNYPPLAEARPYYLGQALGTLQELLVTDPFDDAEQYIRHTNRFLQLLVNYHKFPAINMSMYMNMTNGLLTIARQPGMEHGILDFAAMRLQPDNFHRYFLSELLEQQTAAGR